MINEVSAVVTAEGLEAYREELFGVMAAYADCWTSERAGYIQRSLSFRAEGFVPVPVAMQILRLAGVTSYNAFDYKCLKFFNPRCTVSIAREGSVCLYVSRPNDKIAMPAARVMLADEMDVVENEDNNVFRYWWD